MPPFQLRPGRPSLCPDTLAGSFSRGTGEEAPLKDCIYPLCFRGVAQPPCFVQNVLWYLASQCSPQHHHPVGTSKKCTVVGLLNQYQHLTPCPGDYYICTFKIEKHWTLVNRLAHFRLSMGQKPMLPHPAKIFPSSQQPKLRPKQVFLGFQETSKKSCWLSHPAT